MSREVREGLGHSALLTLVVGTALAASPGAPRAGDPRRGEAIYVRCGACHSLTYDRTGPRHCGLIGRRAGSVAGFAYSEAMERSAIVWSAAELDRFLRDPMARVPGTSMGYAGIADAQERADVIAYLRSANDGPECRESRTS